MVFKCYFVQIYINFIYYVYLDLLKIHKFFKSSKFQVSYLNRTSCKKIPLCSSRRGIR
jgi:hypothetical protein